MAFALGLPIIVMVENGLREEGLLEEKYDWYVERLSISADAFSDRDVRGRIMAWCRRVQTEKPQHAVHGQIDVEMTIADLVKMLTIKTALAFVTTMFAIFVFGLLVGRSPLWRFSVGATQKDVSVVLRPRHFALRKISEPFRQHDSGGNGSDAIGRNQLVPNPSPPSSIAPVSSCQAASSRSATGKFINLLSWSFITSGSQAFSSDLRRIALTKTLIAAASVYSPSLYSAWPISGKCPDSFAHLIRRRLRFACPAVDIAVAYSCSIWRTMRWRRCSVTARPPG